MLQILLYCIIVYSIVLDCILLYCIVLYFTVLYYISQYCTILKDYKPNFDIQPLGRFLKDYKPNFDIQPLGRFLKDYKPNFDIQPLGRFLKDGFSTILYCIVFCYIDYTVYCNILSCTAIYCMYYTPMYRDVLCTADCMYSITFSVQCIVY